jgi:transposase InsO family protein
MSEFMESNSGVGALDEGGGPECKRANKSWNEGPPPSSARPSAGVLGAAEETTSPGGQDQRQDHSPVPPVEEEPPAGLSPEGQPEGISEEPLRKLRLTGRGQGSPRYRAPAALDPAAAKMTPEQRLLILDTWQRSGLPAGDFAALVGVTKHTLYAWKKRFDEQGPGGLMDHTRGKTGSKLPDLTKRSILMLKQAHPDYGCQRISDLLLRGPGLPASAGAVARVLQEAGYVSEEQPTKPHPDHVRSFERAKPNQLWQTDLFTFMLKRQNRRVYLVAFMDDHSRFIVSYGLHASQSTALVMEVFRAGVTSCGTPEEILTDNGSQYVTWRGKSVFARELEKRGIHHVIASPHRPQTLGKIERFWGSLWRECLEAAVFLDLADAQRRIGHFIDFYNFQRPHQGLEGLVPADRFFQAAPEVKKTLQARVAGNALELAKNGLPKAPFYLTGQVGGKSFSVHAEGERVIMTQEGQNRREIDLTPPPPPRETMPEPVVGQGMVTTDWPLPEEAPPGVSPLDEGLRQIQASLNRTAEGGQP